MVPLFLLSSSVHLCGFKDFLPQQAELTLQVFLQSCVLCLPCSALWSNVFYSSCSLLSWLPSLGFQLHHAHAQVSGGQEEAGRETFELCTRLVAKVASCIGHHWAASKAFSQQQFWFLSAAQLWLVHLAERGRNVSLNKHARPQREWRNKGASSISWGSKAKNILPCDK